MRSCLHNAYGSITLQPAVKALAVDVGHVRAEALPALGLHRRIQPRPFVAAAHDTRRAETFRAVAPAVPVYEPEARLVEGHHLQRLAGRLGADPPQLARELFLKASCSFASAFSWRGRPVLSFTLPRLKSPPTL